jgi:predicted peptidase
MQKKLTRIFLSILTLCLSLALAQPTISQDPAPAKKPMPKFMTIKPDPRAEQRKYLFEETHEELSYVLYVSSKVTKEKKNPMIVALHGLGGDANFIVRDRLVDLAEEGGYIAVGPLGYNVSGWYGSPVVAFGGRPVEPPNLTELSEKDVMNVVAMMEKEFNVDKNRIYLVGHSMGGAGTIYLGQKYKEKWAALAPIAPAAFMMLQNREEILTPIRDAKIPVMIVQGEQDNAVPVNFTHQWVETMKELGMDYYYLEFPFGDHGTIIADGMPDIFRFFARYTKEGKIEPVRPKYPFGRKTPPVNDE